MDPHGFAAIHFAAAHGHRAVVDALLKLGADPSLLTGAGHAPAVIAAAAGHTDLAAFLERKSEARLGLGLKINGGGKGSNIALPSGWRRATIS